MAAAIRTSRWVCLFAAALLWGACGDDSGGSNGADGPSGSYDGGGGGYSDGGGGGGSDGGGGGSKDSGGGGGGKKDGGGGGGKDSGGGGGKDSGGGGGSDGSGGGTSNYQATVCKSSSTCGSGSTCVFANWKYTKGLCAKDCKTNTDCETADRKKYGLSQMCVSGSITKNGQTTTYKACAFICKDEFGKTYKCPKGTTCYMINTKQGMCVPPQ